MFFQKPGERNPAPTPACLSLPGYIVWPAETLRYLRSFLHHRLNWEPHVWIMCNRARVSIKALMVLGNTI